MKMRLFILLFIAFSISGCRQQAEPKLTLPVAPDTIAIVDYPPTVQEVYFDQDKVIWFRGRIVSQGELKSQLKSTFDKHRVCPVAIGADSQLLFQSLWEIIQIPVDLGSWRPSLTVFRDKESGTRYMDFQTKAPQLSKDSVIIECKAQSFTLAGKNVDFTGLKKLLSRLANFSRNLQIVIIPDPDYTVQEVVDILNQCVLFSDVYILKESPVLPELEDAQQTN